MKLIGFTTAKLARMVADQPPGKAKGKLKQAGDKLGKLGKLPKPKKGK